MSKHKKHAPAQSRPRPLPPAVERRLDEAEALLQRKQWPEAREMLEELDQRHPGRAEVLSGLVNACAGMRDAPGYEDACLHLVEVDPRDPVTLFALAHAYLQNIRPALALRTTRQFVERWPEHESAGEARKMAAEIEAHIDELLANASLTGPDALEVLTLLDEMRAQMTHGRFAQARRAAGEILRLRPGFAPALNNLSMIEWFEGRLDDAIATARRVLASEPANFHALGNLVRYLCLAGRPDEARQIAAQLKPITLSNHDLWAKQLEAFTFLGDDQAVLEIYSRIERDLQATKLPGDAIVYHLTAVAQLRLGREREARRHWERALKLAPALEIARENLNDLRKPVGERQAPWPFDLQEWVPNKTLADLVATLKPAATSGEKQAERAIRKFLDHHPELVAIVPLLLDRGDPDARLMAFRLATGAGTPAMLAALRDFALGQRGPDQLRYDAALTASRAGLLPEDVPVQMWSQETWQEVQILDREIYTENEDDPRLHRVEQLTQAAMDALHAGDGARGERLLKQALEVVPDHPSLLNNLAAAYGMQGRAKESEALIREIYERHPEYFFGRTNMAKLLVKERKLEQALEVLKPISTQKRMHVSEYAALASAQIEVALAQGEIQSAQQWLDMWAQIAPDHPQLSIYRGQLRSFKLLGRLSGRPRPGR